MILGNVICPACQAEESAYKNEDGQLSVFLSNCGEVCSIIADTVYAMREDEFRELRANPEGWKTWAEALRNLDSATSVAAMERLSMN